MRQIAFLLVVVLAGCSGFFTPPCTTLARVICNLPDQGDACAFVLDRGRGDDRAQGVCKAVLPAAKALQKDGSSAEAQAGWAAAREKLDGLGMQANPNQGSLANKVKAWGGLPGRTVQRLENANQLEKTHINGAVNQVFKDANR